VSRGTPSCRPAPSGAASVTLQAVEALLERPPCLAANESAASSAGHCNLSRALDARDASRRNHYLETGGVAGDVRERTLQP
jgi:hypothetical protein